MTLRQVIQSGPAKANELFTRLTETGNGAVKTRERLFADLKLELELVAGLEEQHLFPLLRKRPETKALVADALADNKQVRGLLAELEPMPKEGQDFPAKLAELRKAFQQHVRDEKRELLPAVAKALSDEEAQTVAEKIAAGKTEAEEAQREEAERQRAEVRREREQAAAEQAKQEEAARHHAQTKRERGEAKQAKRQAAADQAKQEETERQHAQTKREREEAKQAKRQVAADEQATADQAKAADQAKQEEAERQRAQTKREREQASRDQAERREAEAADRRALQVAVEAVARPVEVAAQIGLRAVEADSAATEVGGDIAARGSRQAMDTASQAVQRTATAASGTARRYQAAASQLLTAEGGFAGFWLELVREQVAHNAETFGKLAATRDLGEVFELQGTLVRVSLERIGRLNGRYLEAVQAMLTAAGSATTNGTDQAA